MCRAGCIESRRATRVWTTLPIVKLPFLLSSGPRAALCAALPRYRRLLPPPRLSLGSRQALPSMLRRWVISARSSWGGRCSTGGRTVAGRRPRGAFAHVVAYTRQTGVGAAQHCGSTADTLPGRAPGPALLVRCLVRVVPGRPVYIANQAQENIQTLSHLTNRAETQHLQFDVRFIMMIISMPGQSGCPGRAVAGPGAWSRRGHPAGRPRPERLTCSPSSSLGLRVQLIYRQVRPSPPPGWSGVLHLQLN